MISILLDTNAVSELIRNPDGPLSQTVWRRAESIGISIVVAGELRYGAEKRRSPQLTRLIDATLRSIPTLPLEQPAELRWVECSAQYHPKLFTATAPALSDSAGQPASHSLGRTFST